MTRCKCWDEKTHKPKKMRLRRDGWKRCFKCGVERPGLAIIAQRGRERMQREGWALLPALAPVNSLPETASAPHRLAVVWSSLNDNTDQYEARLEAVRGEMAHV